MLESRLTASSDLPAWAVALACVLGLVSVVMLVVELRTRRGGSAAVIAGSGVIAVLSLVLAVLRPVRIAARESVVGARVVVLADASRSMALPGDDASKKRFEARAAAIHELGKASPDARWIVLGFGEGAPSPLAEGEPGARARSSDLGAALRALAASTEERPSAVVVVSDGRLDDAAELGSAFGGRRRQRWSSRRRRRAGIGGARSPRSAGARGRDDAQRFAGRQRASRGHAGRRDRARAPALARRGGV
jgi:hypothetical protein